MFTLNSRSQPQPQGLPMKNSRRNTARDHTARDRTAAALSAIVLLGGLSLVSATPAVAADEGLSSGFLFSVASGYGTITGYVGSDRVVTIPTEIIHDNHPFEVSEISENAFAEHANIERVVIPDSVRVIGERAFSGMASLTSVYIGNSVEVIPDGAFSDSPNLVSLHIGNSVKTIESMAFFGAGLVSVVIPRSVEEIVTHAFGGYTESLHSVTFLGNAPKITSIESGSGSFYWDDGPGPTLFYYPGAGVHLDAVPFAELTAAGYVVSELAERLPSTANIKAGPRTAALSNVDFGDDNSVGYSQVAHEITGTATLSVEDKSGSAAGWAVTVQASEFVWSRGANTATSATAIPASAFSISTTGVAAAVTGGGQAWAATAVPRTGTLSGAVTVLTAASSTGQGSYTMPVTVALQIPAASRAGSYTSTLTTTLSVSP
jgi:hypothetical protein